MKTTKSRSRNTKSKNMIMRHLQMNRFIREIEREDPLENDLLKTMLVLQLQVVH